MDDSLRKRIGLPDTPDTLYLISIDDLEVAPDQIITLQITRENVLRGHLESYLREFKKFEKKKLRSQITINFAGYNNDLREIYQIREIRNWVHRLFTNVPNLFYFLCKEDYVTMFLCLMEIEEKDGEAVSINKGKASRLIEKITKGVVLYLNRSKEPLILQFNMAEQIMAALDYDQSTMTPGDAW